MNTEDHTALAIVRLGYALDDPTDKARCLHFRVQFKDAESAAEACRAIESYNDFDGGLVAETIARLARLNDGLRFSVGREGSPVLYVEGFGVDQDRIAAVLSEARPDECDPTNYGVRAWWD